MGSIYKEYGYPEGMEYFTKRNITTIGNWDILDSDNLEIKLRGIRDRYQNEKLLPFACHEITDDVACFEEESGNKVFIIHDYSYPGKEKGKIFSCVEDFVKDALAEWVEEAIMDYESDNETFEEIMNVFRDTSKFAKDVEKIDFNKDCFETYSFELDKCYVEMEMLKKENFSIEEGFARIFKELIFKDEQWEREMDKKYKDEGWSNHIEKFWIPEYFFSGDSLSILPADINVYKKEILNLNNTKDSFDLLFLINENEFENAEAVLYNRYFNSSNTFINSKNYYINFRISYED